MLTVLYVIGLMMVTVIITPQAKAQNYTPQEILSAIQLYEQEIATAASAQQNNPSDKSSQNDAASFNVIKMLCTLEIAFANFAHFGTYFIGPVLQSFGHAALGGDILTGNAFAEGRDKKNLVALKLNKTLLAEQQVSLHTLFEIFERLNEDIAERANYLGHRPDKEEILTLLRNRKQRLMNNLEVIENHVFHFRKHPSLHMYQKRILIASAILVPIIYSFWVASSFDFETEAWHKTTPSLIDKNIQFLSKKFFNN